MKEVDDSDSGRFNLPPYRPEEAWKPGVVEVEFKESPFPELSLEIFSQSVESMAHSGAWSAGLKHTLDNNRHLRWTLSFPLSYPWSNEDTEKALDFYLASGRDKFITFYFPREADVLRIARELEELPEVAHAAPVPKLAPVVPAQ